MAIDAFLELEGIKGESTDDKHKDLIQVQSWNMGISFMHDASGPGGRGGRSDFSPLSIMKVVDLASCELYQACAMGKPIDKGTLFLQTSTGSSKFDFLVIKLQDLRITSIAPGGGGDVPMESVSFSYGTIQWDYQQLNTETGAVKGSNSASWDLREKKKL